MLLKHGYSFSFHPPSAGRLAISWYLVPKGAHVSAARPVLIARGLAAFRHARPATVTIRLTAAGKRLLKHASRFTATSTCAFTPTGQPAAASISRTFTLRR